MHAIFKMKNEDKRNIDKSLSALNTSRRRLHLVITDDAMPKKLEALSLAEIEAITFHNDRILDILTRDKG